MFFEDICIFVKKTKEGEKRKKKTQKQSINTKETGNPWTKSQHINPSHMGAIWNFEIRESSKRAETKEEMKQSIQESNKTLR